MRVPPAVYQFTRAANKPYANTVINFLKKYSVDPRAAKAAAEKKAESGSTEATKAGVTLTHGVNQVVKMIERKKAQLVVIAHDVDPIDLVVYIPALCAKLDVPYVIVKSKSRLGEVVFKKNCSCACLTSIRKEDKDEFSQIVEQARGAFNSQYSRIRKEWGGIVLSKRSRAHIAKLNQE
eukprot:CAMPEP_0117424176 /NCGR_PEP_ID=MMETSP0758-20121206/4648_1 /TAXON_ID=63605 /ORGANISM="Percolomonas cosmopolitus, Strain AE-1 (ATCC 50343)" /LENGTH=178 /DNA_ID=CAMNT_0005207799 /DNA_START=230 /DNA_END=766 /DNA_ORIENTATION=+